MEYMKTSDIPLNKLPGCGIQKAVGNEPDTVISSDVMKVSICTYSRKYGPMIPVHHAEETIVVLRSDQAWVEWGGFSDEMPEEFPGRQELAAGDILHFPDLEWHVFRFPEDGSLTVASIYAL